MSIVTKDIQGYEGEYLISSLGTVTSLKRNITLKEDIAVSGYRRVTLSSEGNTKRYLVHRLVAQTFIPNPENKPHINHIDNDPNNNSVDNLEWCTHSENMIHAHKQGRLANIKASQAAVSVNYLRYTEMHKEKLGERFIAYYPPYAVLDTPRGGKKEKSAVKYICMECSEVRIGIVGWKELREHLGLCPNCQAKVIVDEDIV